MLPEGESVFRPSAQAFSPDGKQLLLEERTTMDEAFGDRYGNAHQAAVQVYDTATWQAVNAGLLAGILELEWQMQGPERARSGIVELHSPAAR